MSAYIRKCKQAGIAHPESPGFYLGLAEIDREDFEEDSERQAALDAYLLVELDRMVEECMVASKKIANRVPILDDPSKLVNLCQVYFESVRYLDKMGYYEMTLPKDREIMKRRLNLGRVIMENPDNYKLIRNCGKRGEIGKNAIRKLEKTEPYVQTEEGVVDISNWEIAHQMTDIAFEDAGYSYP
jgi:hypothetical protein